MRCIIKKVRVVLLPFFLFAVLVVNFLLLPKNIEAAREPWGCLVQMQYYCFLQGELFLNARPLY